MIRIVRYLVFAGAGFSLFFAAPAVAVEIELSQSYKGLNVIETDDLQVAELKEVLFIEENEEIQIKILREINKRRTKPPVASSGSQPDSSQTDVSQAIHAFLSGDHHAVLPLREGMIYEQGPQLLENLETIFTQI
jgi:hypothetical protein